jgi:hypothetical protein
MTCFQYRPKQHVRGPDVLPESGRSTLVTVGKAPGVGYVLTVSEYDLYSSDARVLFQGR